MNAQQTLAALDAAAANYPAADGRRVLAAEATELRAVIQLAEQERGLVAAIESSTGGRRAHLRDELQALQRRARSLDVAAQIAEARRTLALWS